MSQKLFIAGDWGTTNLRLYLCQFKPGQPTEVLHSVTGPGVSQISGDFEQVFFSLVANWLEQHGAVPVILSGMVGSTIGWREAPYLQCPVGAEQIIEGRSHFSARGLEFSIMAGLRVENPLGAPDLMRGEELQLLGWMHAGGVAQRSERLIALPGTHNKWVLIRGGQVETFVTAPTGELFSALQNHSVLIADPGAGNFSPEAFIQGVSALGKLRGAQLLHAIFATRSRQVVGDLSEQDASSYLSGLLIGSDVIGATTLMREYLPDLTSVTLIGDNALSQYYQLALEQLNLSAEICDARQIAITGYQAIYSYLYTGEKS